MKWWSADEVSLERQQYGGQLICDAFQWRVNSAPSALSAGLRPVDRIGRRGASDIPAGPITYTQIYETYPWRRHTLRGHMTGAESTITSSCTDCDVAISAAGRSRFLWKSDAGLPVMDSRSIALGLQRYRSVIHVFARFRAVHRSGPQTSSVLGAIRSSSSPPSRPGQSLQRGDSRYLLNTDFLGRLPRGRDDDERQRLRRNVLTTRSSVS